ncbi:FAD-linked oxidoreductase OXR1 [Physcia stellaris]|nr:FAD-linked oxidoreductase OXR1 [Physcia stellaris]
MLFNSILAGVGLFASIVFSAPTFEGTTRLDTFEKRDVASTLATRLSPGATIIFPQDPEWNNVTERWTKYLAPSFRVAVEPVTESDVVAIVNYAVSRNINFLAQNGRHGYAPELQKVQNGILINMEHIDHVKINKQTGIVTVGGGTVYEQVINATYAAGREMTVGSCPCVGVLGAALGGGHGRLQGLHGMSIDALRRLRVVLANGKVINVSEKENADLWWGIRGAGQNFGIVVEADFQSAPQVLQGQHYDVEMQFADDKLEKVLELMNQQIKAPLPAQLAVDIVFGANTTTLKPIIAINFVYAGPQSEGRKWSAPWKALGPLTFVEASFNWSELPFKAANGLIAAQCLKYGFKNTYSVNLATFNTATMRAVYTSWGNFLAAHPNVNASTILFEVYGQQAVRAAPSAGSAFPNRATSSILTVLTSWYTDASLSPTVDSWTSGLRAQMQRTSGYDKLHVYQNYAHSEPLQAFYGYEAWRLPRLQKLKRRFDGGDVFGGYHPVPV